MGNRGEKGDGGAASLEDRNGIAVILRLTTAADFISTLCETGDKGEVNGGPY